MNEHQRVPLGDLVVAPGTWNPTRANGTSTFTYIDLAAVDQDSKVIATARQVLACEAPSRARQVVAHQDILVSTVRPNLNAVARVPSSLDTAIASTGFCILRPNPEKLNSSYLFHWVKTPDFVSHMVRRATGASYPAVSDRIVLSSEIPLPPLAEQRRIAQVLDEADAMRTKRRAAINLLDAMISSVFLELFGDPRTNDRDWATRRIGDIVTDFRGGASLAPDDFVSSGFPILHKGAIRPNGRILLDAKKKTFALAGYAEANQRSQVDRSYLAVTLRDLVPSGPTIGLVASLAEGPYDRYLLAQGVYGFHLLPNTVQPEYFVHLSNMPTFRHVLRQNAVGSTQIHVRNPVYRDIAIPVPPDAIQRVFAKTTSLLADTETEQQRSLARMDALFTSLQYRAFRGEL